MHTRALDAVQRGNGAGQFAFERADIVDVLHEAGGAQCRLLVEDFIADLATGRQPLAGQLHAQGGDLVAWHKDGVAFAAQFIGNVGGLQLADDRGRIFEAEAGIERGEIGGLGPQNQEGEKAEHQHCHHGHCGHSRQSDPVNKVG